MCWTRTVLVAVAVTVGSIVTLAACDGCAFVPCDGIGFGVWVTNESEDELLIQFDPPPEGGSLFAVPPGVIDGAGPWVYVNSNADGRPTDGRITVLSSGCEVIDTFAAAPGEYRLRIGPDGTASLIAEDVPNDLGSAPLVSASTECG